MLTFILFLIAFGAVGAVLYLRSSKVKAVIDSEKDKAAAYIKANV